VDDWATTLLMARFHELCQPARPGHGMPPVSAPWEARRWLRALSGAEADAYVREHAELSALRIRSWDTQPSELPFQEPRFWAVFTALGC
jgi:CHAT domain-containing protein